MAHKRDADKIISVKAGPRFAFNDNIFLSTCWSIEDNLKYLPARRGIIKAFRNTFTRIPIEDKCRWLENLRDIELPRDREIRFDVLPEPKDIDDASEFSRRFVNEFPAERRYLYSISATGQAWEGLPEGDWGNPGRDTTTKEQVKGIFSERIRQLSPWFDGDEVEKAADYEYAQIRDFHSTLESRIDRGGLKGMPKSGISTALLNVNSST